MYSKRREKLFQNSDADCVVLVNVEGSSRPSLIYYTGFTGTFATLVLSKKGEWFITDPRYTEQAKKQTGMKIAEYRGQKKFHEFLSDFLNDLGCKTVGIEKERINLSLFERFSSGIDAEFVGVDEIVRKMRMVKSEDEIEKIKKAI
jgi:Xaa-Pro aminopeptidase